MKNRPRIKVMDAIIVREFGGKSKSTMELHCSDYIIFSIHQ